MSALLIVAAFGLPACGSPAGAKIASGSAGAGGAGGAAAGAGGGAGGESGDAGTGGAEAGSAGGDAGGTATAGDGGGGDAGTGGPDGGAGATSTGGAGGADGGATMGSPGCGAPLGIDDVIAKFVARTVDVKGLADVYLPGGALSNVSGDFNLSRRPYAVRLPAFYDIGTPLAVRFEAGGCGRTATAFAAAPFSDFAVDPAQKIPTIEVALASVGACFVDGGPSIDDRTDSPEVPYFRAVLADVEARYCVDRSRVFVAGRYSGAWEAELLGCAAADVVRATATFSGGLRAHRPACTGPVAAILIGSTLDPESPLGPLAPTDPAFARNDSPGLIPMRDDILARNGCLGSPTHQWNPALPFCVTFTDCPAALPVVWCPLSTQGMVPGITGGAAYTPGALLTFLTGLPPAP
jgi:poly(3-hydroxybutyrate) depolymerase